MGLTLIPCPICRDKSVSNCTGCHDNGYIVVNPASDCIACGFSHSNCGCDPSGGFFDEDDGFSDYEEYCREIVEDLRAEGAVITDDGIIKLP